MEFAKKINGAVFFVDVLGFGALTQNKLDLKDVHFEPWLKSLKKKLHFIEYTNQFLAASILVTFRDILKKTIDDFKDVKVAQLSDCAFAWSENISNMVIFVNNFMTRATCEGLLCRGGLSYGEIIETEESNNDNYSLGKFILGEAVTNAVKLEGRPKGCRVLINQELPSELSKQDEKFYSQIVHMFQPFTNLIDYSIYDEFKWYLIPMLNKKINTINIPINDKVKYTQERLKIAANLRCGTKFLWNDSSKEGHTHINASLDFLTDYDDKIFKIWHDFRWESTDYYSIDNSLRSDGLLKSLKEAIKEFSNYKFVEENTTKNKIERIFHDIK